MDETLRNILNMLPQPAFLLDESRILWYNTAAQALCPEALSAEEILGSDPALLPKEIPESKLQRSAMLHGQAYSLTIQRQDTCFLAIASPIGEALSSEDTLSHALRRPLQELMAAAGTLFGALSDSPLMTGAAAEVNRSIYQLQRLCLQSSEGRKLLSQDYAIQRRSHCITELLDEFVASCRDLLTAAGYELRYTPMAEQVVADIDGPLLERALYQLLANAMAYSPKDRPICLSCEKQDRLFLIHMADQGPGFRPDILAGLYTRTLQQPFADPRSGLGLGLPVVKRIAELHGGSLMLRSSDQGTIATLSISLARAPLSLRSVMYHTDLYGGHNPALVELSHLLPASLFDPEEIET